MMTSTKTPYSASNSVTKYLHIIFILYCSYSLRISDSHQMLITYFKYVESLLVTFQNLPNFPMPCCPILLLRALNLANSLTSLTHCPSVHDFHSLAESTQFSPFIDLFHPLPISSRFWAGPQHSFSHTQDGLFVVSLNSFLQLTLLFQNQKKHFNLPFISVIFSD